MEEVRRRTRTAAEAEAPPAALPLQIGPDRGRISQGSHDPQATATGRAAAEVGGKHPGQQGRPPQQCGSEQTQSPWAWPSPQITHGVRSSRKVHTFPNLSSHSLASTNRRSASGETEANSALARLVTSRISGCLEGSSTSATRPSPKP